MELNLDTIDSQFMVDFQTVHEFQIMVEDRQISSDVPQHDELVVLHVDAGQFPVVVLLPLFQVQGMRVHRFVHG